MGETATAIFKSQVPQFFQGFLISRVKGKYSFASMKYSHECYVATFDGKGGMRFYKEFGRSMILCRLNDLCLRIAQFLCTDRHGYGTRAMIMLFRSLGLYNRLCPP